MAMVQHLLLIEDSVSLARVLEDVLQSRAERITHVTTLAAAREVLRTQPPDAVLLDVSLPDGTSDSLLDDLLAVEPLPYVIAISGSATAEQAFRLAASGVRAFVPKPLDLARLEAVWTQTLSGPPELGPALRASAGKVPLHHFESLVRDTLVDEALAKSGGSVRGAAKLLQISRQLLQHILNARD
ncbi:response regulator [Myxococcus sp. CA051A]|uniref:Response regulator n=2 Tax=Myxococcaceae TaxID=31 RepID=A0A540X8H0_9BACT|nr:response regulator [Myxococcus sp. CA040A]NTX62010.1 response regulator [Myxococcus sp. CA051A]TQF17438.1 response regulator [Myxococcus llanfairpwllgwyngyllgogerychwyrndrobwllllantysiliogogogochensis]